MFTCYKILFIKRPVDCENELLHSGSRLISGARLLASCFQQLCGAGFKLSPVRPKVLDATACSYLTWALALCVCTINTMPHELYSWEGRRRRRGDVLFFGGGGSWDTKVFPDTKKPTQMLFVMSVNVEFENGFIGEQPATYRLPRGNSGGVNTISEAYMTGLNQ